MQAVTWYDELEQIAGDSAKLSPRARRALRKVVVSILSEGEQCPAKLEPVVAKLIAD